MKRTILSIIAVAGAVAAPLVAPAAADAAPAGTVHFSVGDSFNCAITADGKVGCDLPTPRQMTITMNGTDRPVPFKVREVLIDSASLPAHPGPGVGTPHTLPGGNPPIEQVGHPSGTGADSGPEVDHGGASCRLGFHGSFSCKSKGHGFGYYETITAN
ncbi:hypothetical protein P0W64_10100 [Tsukamurella sp. 8F]|uniref:hypothetical protein n=1 Tax=unclassified Tsukamurella TaxID=2633480 RepID=UPI0023B90C21|nr:MULTISPECIES: hypothetical protein [unclassified Tsukamurella]MDF0529371.1 hypothetical protein [Tsukamurella sp. 8J]MDF0587122.1 hypothetical protein [Tsukamurella sp. 8F]